MSTTAVCLASAFSKRMSDLFLLPCVVSPSPSPTPLLPPAPFLASVHTLRLSHSGCPGPPPLLSPLQCLHMQSLSECAMSFLLGSASSFTVDWFLFRSRGNGPPPPFSIIPPSSPSSFSSPRAGKRRGKWARRALHGGWQRRSRSTCPGCREGAGGAWAPPPHPAISFRAGEMGGKGSPATPRRRRAPVPAAAGGGRTPPPQSPGQSCCAAQPPPPPPTRCTQTPTRAQTFVLLIW